MIKIEEKNWQELRNMAIDNIQWDKEYESSGVTLNDGQSCMAGPDSDLVESYKFDPNRKITRVEVIDDYDGEIWIKFYSGENFQIKLLFLRQE